MGGRNEQERRVKEKWIKGRKEEGGGEVKQIMTEGIHVWRKVRY